MNEYDPSLPNDYDELKRGLGKTQNKKEFVGTVDSKIGEKLLKKMGWTQGKGLGKDEQGITEPIVARKVGRRQGILDVSFSGNS